MHTPTAQNSGHLAATCRLIKTADDASAQLARLLWRRAQPVAGTIAETYLRSALGLALRAWPAHLRFLPADPPRHPWPALAIACGTPAGDDEVGGLHLTALRLDGLGTAEVNPVRRYIGCQFGRVPSGIAARLVGIPDAR